MYYAGLDLSTQQLKLLIIDSSMNIIKSYSVEFDADFPQYNTEKGVYHRDGAEVCAPVLMWIEALDSVLEKMVKDDFPMSEIAGISGSCQQHGSVFWSRDPDVSSCDASQPLHLQLGSSFSMETAPNWQDHSTGAELPLFGDSSTLAQITGSKAHYRFTGPQICKFRARHPAKYACTERISLVSSFLSSLFVGHIVGIEEGDACGMNLYDITKKEWNDTLLEVAGGPELKKKLGPVTPAGCSKPLGKISSYFVDRYNFSPNCEVFSFTGDNLATILSLPLQKDDVLVSLGTSTTILLVTEKYEPSPNYHLFIHPTIPDHYMGMICYCNGALAREKVRDNLTEPTWDQFEKLLNQEPQNKLGVYFPLDEIVPNSKAKTARVEFDNEKLTSVDSFGNYEPRAIVESQALSCRVRISPLLSVREKTIPSVKPLTFDDGEISAEQLSQRPARAFFVGGGSNSKGIVSTFSEVLGPKNSYTLNTPNACAFGGAIKALWSSEHGNESFAQWFEQSYNWKDAKEVQFTDRWDSYCDKVEVLQKLEQ